MQRYNLWKGSDMLEAEDRGELILNRFNKDNLFASNVPTDLYDAVLRTVDYIETSLSVTGVEIIFNETNYFIEKTQ